MEHLPWVGGNSHDIAARLVMLGRGYFSWGFVRHPLDRLVSAYVGLRSNRWHSTPDVDERSFVDWVDYLAEDRERLTRYMQTLPMVHYLCDDENTVLVDFVGRFERLADDWAEVSRRITGTARELPSRNRSSRPAEWWRFYDPLSEWKARELYAEDFETFYPDEK